jgi:hypothetical protein
MATNADIVKRNAWKIVAIVSILIIPHFLWGPKGPIISFFTFLVGFSRSTVQYMWLRVEFHSVLLLAVAHTWGAGPALFMVYFSVPLIVMIGTRLGAVVVPTDIFTDSIYLPIFVAVGALAPTQHLFFAAMLTIIIVDNIIMSIVRQLILPFVTIPQRLGIIFANITVNYLLLKYALQWVILTFLK